LEDLVAVGLTDESLCHYECCGRKKQEVRKRRKKTKKRGTYKMGGKKKEKSEDQVEAVDHAPRCALTCVIEARGPFALRANPCLAPRDVSRVALASGNFFS
jgi:hypothetical protein